MFKGEGNVCINELYKGCKIQLRYNFQGSTKYADIITEELKNKKSVDEILNIVFCKYSTFTLLLNIFQR